MSIATALARMSDRIRKRFSDPPSSCVGDGLDLSSLLSPSRQVLGGRERIHAAFEDAARSGYIRADALIEQLHSDHLDGVAEEWRQLDRLEQQLEAHLRSWDSLYPAAVPPEPAPPEPPRAQRHGPIRDIWGRAGMMRH